MGGCACYVAVKWRLKGNVIVTVVVEEVGDVG